MNDEQKSLCTARYISDRVANNGEPQDIITWFDCSENVWCTVHGCKEAGECQCPEPKIDWTEQA